jgi:hypothetical protein
LLTHAQHARRIACRQRNTIKRHIETGDLQKRLELILLCHLRRQRLGQNQRYDTQQERRFCKQLAHIHLILFQIP